MTCGLKQRLTPRALRADELERMPLNAYFLDCGEVPFACCDVGGQTHYETERLVGIVVAKTSQMARYAFWKANEWDLGDLNEVTWKETRLVARDVQYECGIVDFGHPLWKLTCPAHWGQKCTYDDHREEADELGLSREEWEEAG
ncbi:hypothetical protein LCGC14_2283590 [marine sediment metagenome]|uniref:Uncharacterized protein n=1 Tax=marine sediment metagenome TaxID=412755 RepID=A0A0F9DFT9_9ZZZZ